MSEIKNFSGPQGQLDYLEIDNGGKETIIMLHGYGANMRDLAPIASIVPELRAYNWIFPDGPIKVPIGPMMYGKAWFPLDMEALNHAMITNSFESLFSDALPSGLQEASDLLQSFIKSKISGDYIIGGFSQGSMMACDLSLTKDLNPQALILLSSTLVAKDRMSSALSSASSIPTFQSHGVQDAVLPVKMAQALRDALIAADWKPSYHEFNGGHEISPVILQELVRFLGELKS